MYWSWGKFKIKMTKDSSNEQKVNNLIQKILVRKQT